jgi:hypothetical protein
MHTSVPSRVNRTHYRAAALLSASPQLAESISRSQALPGRANSGREQMQQKTLYSITSSARPSTIAGTSRPSALAVLRLSANTYLVGACTGRSAGFSPLRMRST